MVRFKLRGGVGKPNKEAAVMKNNLDHLYKCVAQGSLNNGLKEKCNFKFRFQEGCHHCPLCGNKLERVPNGPTVSELLRLGRRTEEEPTRS